MSRFKVITGIILRHINYGEAEKLFIISTVLGKRKAFAKGVRKVTSKNAGNLELFTHAHIQLVEGNSDRQIITSAVSIDRFDSFAYQIEKYTLALFASEYIDITSTEDDENSFHHLLIILHAIKDNTNYVNLLIFIITHFTLMSGIQINIFECVLCQTPTTQEDVYYSHSYSGIICNSCRKIHTSNELGNLSELSLFQIKIIRNAYRSLQKPMEHNIDKQHAAPAIEFMYNHVMVHIGHPCKTWTMVKDIILK